jgi:ABC-type sugar transport system ATPase subunit
VLRRGRLVGQRRIRDTNEDEIVSLITGAQDGDEPEHDTLAESEAS